jgi:MoaA/NifB/PqqE/SkfB family radical SAM enzyme
VNPGLRNLAGLHLLLTYGCTSACDHCFVYGSPRSDQVFTLAQIKEIIRQAAQVPSVKSFYFEGGEPFLYYGHLLEGIRLAREAGYICGMVTNSYWASSVEDAEVYLRPLVELGIADFSVSDDELHADPDGPNRARFARQAAENLGIPTGSICIEVPKAAGTEERGGEPILGGNIVFKGRAVDNLTADLPTRPAASFTSCDQENFLDIGRVHIDPMGWVHACQGITVGNLWEKPLRQIIAEYDPENEPIIGPLIRGGPVELAKQHAIDVGERFVDACHMCFLLRRELLDRFPDKLAPRRVYGLTEDSKQ